MNKIFVPAEEAEDWKQFLAKPEQWKKGYSARVLAHCWQDAGGMPQDVIAVLAQIPGYEDLETIFAFPEYKVALPGGGRASQNDVWVLGRISRGLVSITVEGKVSESFGETIEQWCAKKTRGKEKRLKFLCKKLGLPFPPRPEVRYQLLHRTVSAILEAERLGTNDAAMVVHSFSITHEGFGDYKCFLSLFGLTAGVDQATTKKLGNLDLGFGWVHGEKKYLSC